MPSINSTAEQAHFLQLTGDIATRTAGLFKRLFRDLEQSDPRMDYLTIFTVNEEEDKRRLDAAAASLGQIACNENGPVNKNGAIYRLNPDHTADLPTSLVRVRDPNPESGLNGCADFSVTDYAAARDHVKGVVGYQEMHKEIDGKPYSIVEVVDPELGVAIYLPNISLTREVMGI